MNKYEKFKVLMAQLEDLHNKSGDSLDISLNCLELCLLLIKKNIDYGSSALAPMRVFSRSDTLEQINVRIDDKLSRIKNSDDKFFDEDVDLDMAGYLILRKIIKKRMLDNL
jgi:hypothetical protein